MRPVSATSHAISANPNTWRNTARAQAPSNSLVGTRNHAMKRSSLLAYVERGWTMKKIAIEEHFLLPELDDYFRMLTNGVSGESFDPVLPKFWDLGAGRLADMDEKGIERSILSCFNYGSVQLDPDPSRAVDVARRMNDILAERITHDP